MGVFVRDIKGLLESVSVDNRGAFERFYNLYYDQVFRFAYYCLGEKEACREVVTDVFFSVWQSRKRLKDIDNIDTKLLQKSEMRKNMVMDLIYRGFIYAANYSESHFNPRRSQIKTELRYLFVTTLNR